MSLERGHRRQRAQICFGALMTQGRGDVGEELIDLPFGAVPPAISRHHSHERGDNNRDAHERRGGHIRGIILVGPNL